MTINLVSPLQRVLRPILRMLFLTVTIVTGISILVMGGKLIFLGGSAYYVLAGLAYLSLIVLFYKGNRAVWIFSAGIFALTVAWALYEVGFDFWKLMPRLTVPALIFMLSLWARPHATQAFLAGRKTANAAGWVIFTGLLATLAAAFFPHGGTSNPAVLHSDASRTVAHIDNGENWSSFGRNAAGTRFAPYSQITPENVGKLQVAWTYRTGRLLGKEGGEDKNTPLQIGNVVYACTPLNVIIALDADSGHELWKFDPHARTAEHISCRSVGYYDALKDKTLNQPASVGDATCQQRIVVSTVDARLFTLNAHTGELCSEFGDNGYVDLQHGLQGTDGSVKYHPTSAPLVAGHLVIVGAWVLDLASIVPSGVVRAYDVRDGSLVWAWDAGREVPDGILPDANKPYVPTTPNMWSTPSYDEKLGLVYLPTGNGSPDYWGGHRDQASERFGSSVVAVDVATGRTRWSFQFVHHDVWDYDTPSQPTLFDIKNNSGETIPALIQTTKMGQIFVLDRRDGKPIAEVRELPVPTKGAALGDKMSPTQPHSVGMPGIGNTPLTERSMWGLSMFDQLWCRIDFRQSVYEGNYTPPSDKQYIAYPGVLGGMNWGGISIDESTGMMFVNDIRIPMRMELKTREEVGDQQTSTAEVATKGASIRPQDAGPYGGVVVDMMMSPLGVPCNAPPFGTLSGINLNSKKLVWQIPMGTGEDQFKFAGIKPRLRMPTGMPTLGGPTSTASGLVFYSGTQDYYLRAIDSATGKEVWKTRLPVGSISAPLIYQSPRSGKQYVVVSAGGATRSKEQGDYIIAFTLPDRVSNEQR